MFYRYELEEMIYQGLVKDTVNVVRKQGKIFDVVLDGELTRPWGVVTVERVEDLLGELE